MSVSTTNKTHYNRHIKSVIYTICFSLAMVLTITSCQEPLEYDYSVNGNKVLLVEGKITTDTVRHYVILSQTVLLNNNQVTMETGATVKINHNGEVLDLTEDSPGYYYTAKDVYGVIGDTYELNIVLSSGERYFAETVIPNMPTIDSLKFLFEEFENYDIYNHNLYFHGWELEEEGNAYLWNLYMNDTMYNDTLKKTSFQADDFINGRYIGIDPTTGESNAAIYQLDPEEITADTVKVLVEMESIPKEYFDFWVTLMQQTEWTGSPFDANKADPISNLSNGAMGFFYGASVTRESFQYIPPEESKNITSKSF